MQADFRIVSVGIEVTALANARDLTSTLGNWSRVVIFYIFTRKRATTCTSCSVGIESLFSS